MEKRRKEVKQERVTKLRKRPLTGSRQGTKQNQEEVSGRGRTVCPTSARVGHTYYHVNDKFIFLRALAIQCLLLLG